MNQYRKLYAAVIAQAIKDTQGYRAEGRTAIKDAFLFLCTRRRIEPFLDILGIEWDYWKHRIPQTIDGWADAEARLMIMRLCHKEGWWQ